MKEIKKIRWLFIMKGFIGDRGYLKVDTLFNRQPVKFNQGRSNVVGAFEGGEDSTSKRILDNLKAVKGSIRKVVEKGIAIIQFR